MLANILGLIAVALCWGFTNPFIKRGSKGLEDVTRQYKQSPWWKRQTAELYYLLTRWQYIIPLVINLSGSAVYYKTLGESDLSIAVPIANSLTLALTILAGVFLGEELGSKATMMGIALVFLGVMLCTTATLTSQ
ncbi:uncharacterized protein SPPG_01368 [Spizellomyces punctatus DAOM BR117]|uniref:EamA domain-containing protein n=1 Tax=Spizellomyces punctatus (strain DAOM BR117) TaxID=645134 RepID=A0A0L0HS57_SPIPD|nr:uncharacterized protein SPPG_01368 [Spizellomyces punctatus DAOM BR117]KND03917.1 hypothetical protein SPPG_01368 [Spizellomyces punctatus DAOM BR117]|eukprot:XP_016611956.1 hypothetical protein SPPG_01368 [Spizellomyces punctatus DAOM BR117]